MKKHIVILTILSVSLFQSCGEPAEGMEKLKEERKTIKVRKLTQIKKTINCLKIDEQNRKFIGW